MAVDDIATATAASLDVAVEEFYRRSRAEAEALKAEVHDGTFDHPQAITGVEYAFYAVVDWPTIVASWVSFPRVGPSRKGLLSRV